MAFLQHRMEKLATMGAVAKESAELSNWAYVTADSITTVLAANYFNGMAAKGLQAGDLIAVFASTGAHQIKVASVSAAGVVVVKKYGHAHGQATTVTASDTVSTGLTHASLVVATFNDDPVAGATVVTCDIGDQAGTPAAGSFLLKTWKHTDATHPALIAATTFGIKVNWIAFGW